MRSLLLVSIGFFVLGVGYYYSKSPKYDECLRLYNVVSNGNVEKDLLLWVDENFDNIIAMKGYDKASGVYPGNYEISSYHFDWDILGFDKDLAGIRLIVDDHNVKKLQLDNVISLSFAQWSRVSVIVSKKGSQTYGINDPALRTVGETGRVAVLCAK